MGDLSMATFLAVGFLLRAAQLELIRGEVKTAGADVASAPFYWAAFQVIGDWQ